MMRNISQSCSEFADYEPCKLSLKLSVCRLLPSCVFNSTALALPTWSSLSTRITTHSRPSSSLSAKFLGNWDSTRVPETVALSTWHNWARDVPGGLPWPHGNNLQVENPRKPFQAHLSPKYIQLYSAAWNQKLPAFSAISGVCCAATSNVMDTSAKMGMQYPTLERYSCIHTCDLRSATSRKQIQDDSSHLPHQIERGVLVRSLTAFHLHIPLVHVPVIVVDQGGHIWPFMWGLRHGINTWSTVPGCFKDFKT